MQIVRRLRSGTGEISWEYRQDERDTQMNRQQFKLFVDETLENVIRLAEQETGNKLSRKYCFHWFGRKSEMVCQNIAEHITQKVFIEEDHIYPCVDIGVTDILDDGTLVISANIAGYAPRAFGKNWTDRDGPFVYIIGQELLDRSRRA